MDKLDMLQKAASEARTAPYLAACGGDRTAAVRLYVWNIQISAAFQAPLGCLEIVCRNALHQRLSDLFGRADWWYAPSLRLHNVAQRIASDAVDETSRRHRIATPDRVVAELPFGFWVSFLGSGSDYETRLWRPALCRAFPGYRGRRQPLHRELDEARRLRNRIAHHEPVYGRDLAADHARALRIVALISPEHAEWVRQHDRVPDVLAVRHDVCGGRLVATF
jgi:hypothetical protein